MDVVILLIILAGSYWVIKSGALNAIQPVQQPVAVAPAAGGDNTTPTTDGTGTTTTTPTTTTPTTSTGNPLLDALNDLLGGNTDTQNTIPTTGGQPIPAPVIPGGPIYQRTPECSSRYNGSCNTECASGNASLCNACQIACGGAAVGAVQTLPSQGGANQQLCSSRYNGKCNTECQNGNSSECQACKAACGSFGAWAYYVKTPQSLMTTTVFGNDNHSSYATWEINVQNAR